MGDRRLCGKRIQSRRVGVQKTRHLVDEGARSAGAGFVHAQFHAVREVKELGVFSAKLDRGVEFRRAGPQEEGGGEHFLNEGDMKRLGKAQRARTRKADAQGRCGRFGAGCSHSAERGNQRSAHIALMADVAARKGFARAAQERVLDGGRSEVDA